MTYAVILRLDPAGSTPLILRDDSKELPVADGVRYRLVAQADDYGEAVAVADLLRRRINAEEL